MYTMTYYEVLGIESTATTEDICAAYRDQKSFYAQADMASYSLFSLQDQKQTLLDIEEAFQVLSKPEMRKSYDHSLESPLPERGALQNDMVLEHHVLEEHLESLHSQEGKDQDAASFVWDTSLIAQKREVEESFASLQSCRKMQKISLEKLSKETKIPIKYLQAIEAERFEVLPAVVYVRGFLMQIARTLNISSDYTYHFLERYKAFQHNMRTIKKPFYRSKRFY